MDSTFDDDGRLASTTSGGATTAYAYDSAGHLLARTLPAGNGYTEERTYDRDDRLTEVKSTNGTTTLAQSSYTHLKARKRWAAIIAVVGAAILSIIVVVRMR